jgi:mannan endo-1,4-beta-mannosidase
MYGEWFWWGTKTCSDEEFIELFTFTIDYLRIEKGLNNLLIAYAPSGNVHTREQYLSHYPGDDYVDILGLDNYGDFTIKRLDNIVQQISIVVNLANEKNKLSAFTETGTDKMQINNWYTTNLLQVLKANDKTRSLAYVMVWRNRDVDHFYVPYPEHEQADDFKQFVDDKMIYLLRDYTRFKESIKETK